MGRCKILDVLGMAAVFIALGCDGGDGNSGSEMNDAATDIAVSTTVDSSVLPLDAGDSVVDAGPIDDAIVHDSSPPRPDLGPPCEGPMCGGAWTEMLPLPDILSLHAAVRLNDGRVLVMGGTDVDEMTQRTSMVYDATANTWTQVGNMVGAREGFTATLMADGRVVAVGGNAFSPTAKTDIFDGQSGWQALPDLNEGRASHTATALTDGRLLVVGGTAPPNLASVEFFDLASSQWNAGPPLPSAHANHAAARLSDGRVLVCGGSGGDGNPSAQVHIFDPIANTWAAGASMSAARFRHTATALADGRVLVVGGLNDATAELYDPAADSWSDAGVMAGGRYNHTASALNDGRVLVVGGWNMREFKLDRVEIYDPTGGWSEAAALPISVEEHTATVLTDGSVLVVGGKSATGAVSDVYRWSLSD